MSRYEFERGEITIPSAEWAAFKKAVREAYNRTAQKRLGLALQLHKHLTSRKIKKADLHDEAWKFVNSENTGSIYSGKKYTDEDLSEAVRAVGVVFFSSRSKLRKPLKKDFPIAGNTTTCLEDGEASVTFDNKRRVVVWNVSENNHAVDNAREGSLGKAFFKQLKSVKWTRGSGGTIYGNDEYNRDADYEGGGGHYVTGTYGAADIPFSKRF